MSVKGKVLKRSDNENLIYVYIYIYILFTMSKISLKFVPLGGVSSLRAKGLILALLCCAPSRFGSSILE